MTVISLFGHLIPLLSGLKSRQALEGLRRYTLPRGIRVSSLLWVSTILCHYYVRLLMLLPCACVMCYRMRLNFCGTELLPIANLLNIHKLYLADAGNESTWLTI